MPSLGYGTYGRRGAEGVQAIRLALDTGYRHLDTAQDYNTESEVGQALRESGLPRDTVYVTTKVATGNLAADRVIASLEESRAKMGIDQIDLALIHWPAPNGAIEPEIYLSALKKAQDAGICRHIGVSNFTIALIDRAERLLGPGVLVCNQIELNPLFKNPHIAAHCQARGIRVTCYLPIARGRLSGHPVLARIAERHDATGEQVGLAWEWAKGYAAIPTSSRPDRIVAGFSAQHLRLDAKEIAEIDAIPDEPRVIAPGWGPAWDSTAFNVTRNHHKDHAMNGITGLGHLAIKVKDLDTSLDFWRDRVGLKEMHRLKRDDGATWLVYLRITDSQFLEVFPGAETDHAPGEEANGVLHICLTIEDLDAEVARLEKAGVKIVSPVTGGLDGNRGAWIHDPDGNRIELMEMAPDCLQYKAIRALAGTN